MKKRILGLLIVTIAMIGTGVYTYRKDISVQEQHSLPNSQKIATIYGTMEITEPVLIELINSKSMQRLDGINQYGICLYIKPFMPYTRRIHSLGVLYLLRRFGASLHEQIAGLLHDVSHTVFSHVGDHLFDGQLKSKHRVEGVDSYQDDKHEWFFHQTELAGILARYGIKVKEVLAKNKEFVMLDTQLPDICADRLEYLLYGAYIEEKLSVRDIRAILDCVGFENGKWFFSNVQAARRVADVMTYFMGEDSWGSIWCAVASRWAAQALTRAVEINLLTFDDIHFSTDSVVWNQLCCSDDSIIQELVDKILHCKSCFKRGSAQAHDIHFVQKFRAINPLIKQEDGTFKRLTELDPFYAAQVQKMKKEVEEGAYIAYC